MPFSEKKRLYETLIQVRSSVKKSFNFIVSVSEFLKGHDVRLLMLIMLFHLKKKSWAIIKISKFIVSLSATNICFLSLF